MKATIANVVVEAVQVNSLTSLVNNDGTVSRADPGDWIVTYADGSSYVFPDVLFAELFADQQGQQ